MLAALDEQNAELSELLTSSLSIGDGSGWQRPSLCDGWTVADVVLHLAQTNELAAASAGGRFAEAIESLTKGLRPAESIDDSAALMVARDRDQPGSAIRDRWEVSVEELREGLGSCDPHRRLVWVAGELSAQTLATTRLAETWIHTGDVAAAFGTVVPGTDRLWHVARLAWRTLPYAFAQAGRELTGPVRFDLRGPGGDGWEFVPDSEPLTTVSGDALELCLVAARRVDAADTDLEGRGPDAGAVLELMRTYA